MSTFGEQIKILRKNLGLTQEQLAERLSVNRAALANWETDRAMPDIQMVKELAGVYGVTVDSLLGREDDSFASRVANVIREHEGLLNEEEERFLLGMIVNYLETVMKRHE